jgi:transposase
VVTLRAEEPSARVAEVAEAVCDVRQRWGLPDSTPVLVGYEAGQEGFWLARVLSELDYEVVVMDPASIPVRRHARQRKTDRLDAIALVRLLRRWLLGEVDAFSRVRVPGREEEDQRSVIRERRQLAKERNQHRDRIRKLLRTQGCWVKPVDARLGRQLMTGQLRTAEGRPLPPALLGRLQREWQRLERVMSQLQELEQALTRAEGLDERVRQQVEALTRLRAVGPWSALPLAAELFWRRFDNRREVGACVGLVGQPYDSGESRQDQGISKRGNRWLRAVLIELSWLWIRYQPDSEISRWFRRRTEGQGKRARRVMIVAVARRLVIALWRYLEHGEIPPGAQLKAA